ncbi:MAG: hypothetical protein U0Y68_19885 [Blastocatellia bacterium]
MAKSKSTSDSEMRPTREPSAASQSSEQFSGAGQSSPRDITPEEMAEMQSSKVEAAAPSLAPPQGAGVTAVTVVLSDKRVTGLWGINQDRNSWAHIDGIGWKKLINTSSSANTALTMLAAHARELNRRVDYREEADGMIYEMYIW